MVAKPGGASVPVTTLPGLVSEEMRLYETAEQRLGQPFVMAREATLLLSTFIESVSADREVFIRCMALLKKHHTLALLSVVRRHHVQAMMNLRQVLEAASTAAFALANPSAEYIDPDTAILLSAKEISARSYAWLDTHFPAHSNDLKGLKSDLNSQTSHFNLLQSERIVTSDAEGQSWNTGFFDREDQHLEHVDLWLVAQVGVAVIHLLEQARSRFAGYVPAANLDLRANVVAADCRRLQATMTDTERHKNAVQAAQVARDRKAAARSSKI